MMTSTSAMETYRPVYEDLVHSGIIKPEEESRHYEVLAVTAIRGKEVYIIRCRSIVPSDGRSRAVITYALSGRDRDGWAYYHTIPGLWL
jgi:hypothetical protein